MKTIWHYRDYLPFVSEESRISIGEGQTPLVHSRFIGPSMGLKNLYFKLENLNPTGSYKDRFAALFVSMLRENKTSHCIATSSGNTGAALAAYCAAANMECYLVIVEGAPLAKIQQMQLYGGNVIAVDGFGTDVSISKAVFKQLEEYSKDNQVQLPISAFCYCPEGMKGVQTITWEILDELKGEVDHILSPSGGGGLTLAIAQGLLNYDKFRADCKVHCVQPAGNNTIAGPLRQGLTQATEITASTTAISGLQIPGILDGTQTLLHCRKTKGTGFVVSDNLVFETQKILAQREGIFCEPAGAVSVSALQSALENKEIDRNATIVCLITGSGFKDMQHTVQRFQLPVNGNQYNLKELTNFLSNLKR